MTDIEPCHGGLVTGKDVWSVSYVVQSRKRFPGCVGPTGSYEIYSFHDSYLSLRSCDGKRPSFQWYPDKVWNE